MKQVQFLFLFSVLYLSAEAQQKKSLQRYDFTRLFSPAYRNYIIKSHETFNNSSTSTPVVVTIKYGEKFSLLKTTPIPNTQYYFNPDYGYRKNFGSELLQSDIIGKVIQTVIQEKQLRQILRR